MARSKEVVAKGLAAVFATAIGAIGGFSYVAQDRGLTGQEAQVSSVSVLQPDGRVPVYAQPIPESETSGYATNDDDEHPSG